MVSGLPISLLIPTISGMFLGAPKPHYFRSELSSLLINALNQSWHETVELRIKLRDSPSFLIFALALHTEQRRTFLNQFILSSNRCAKFLGLILARNCARFLIPIYISENAFV
jgi:hypothetical protein